MAHHLLKTTEQVIDEIKKFISTRDNITIDNISNSDVADELQLTLRNLRGIKYKYNYPNPPLINAVSLWCIDNNLSINKYLSKLSSDDLTILNNKK